MPLKKKDTPEAREYWKLAEETSDKVREWPEWKRGNYLSDYVGERPNRFSILMRNAETKEF